MDLGILANQLTPDKTVTNALQTGRLCQEAQAANRYNAFIKLVSKNICFVNPFAIFRYICYDRCIPTSKSRCF